MASFLRGHFRIIYYFYFFFTSGWEPINEGLLSWGTLSGSIRHYPLLVPYSTFFKSSRKCEIWQRQMVYPGRTCITNTPPWEDAKLAKSRWKCKDCALDSKAAGKKYIWRQQNSALLFFFNFLARRSWNLLRNFSNSLIIH